MLIFTREQLNNAIKHAQDDLKAGILREQALIALISGVDAGYIGMNDQDYEKAIIELETIQKKNKTIYHWIGEFQNRLALIG